MLDSNFWKKYFNEYDILNQLIPYNDLLDKVVSKVSKNYKFILDVGSGTGNLSERLSSQGFFVTSLDYSFEGLQKHIQKNANAKVIQHDLINKMPFKDNSFDVIVSNNVLYTFSKEDQKIIIKDMFRVLKNGGLIVVSNLRHGFRPANIYIDHIKRYINEKGFLNTIFHLVKLITPTLKIFYYNFLISRENYLGGYHFFKKDEQIELLNYAGFCNISKTELCYSEQAILNYGFKE